MDPIRPATRLSRRRSVPGRFATEVAQDGLELDTGTVHDIKPGTLYAMNDHDRHRIRAKTRMRIVCTFFPALTSDEVHDADGSL